MRPSFHTVVAILFVSTSNTVSAQKDSVAQISGHWLAPVGVAIAAIVDPEVREWSLREHSHPLNRAAQVINPLGTAHVLVPAMAATFLGARLTDNDGLSRATLKTGVAYLVSDIAESALKPVIGRQRPHVSGNARRFRPFTNDGDWHSLPSAHVAHIASIATAIAEQTHSRTLDLAGRTLVVLVGWDRVYEDQHWTSDVAATMVLTSMMSRATIKWLDSHWRPSPHDSTRAR